MDYILSWFQSDITFESVKNVLVSIPGVVLTIFSLLFAYQRIGNKVLSTFSVTNESNSSNRISDVSLVNKKNKPLTIFSIQAVINNDIVIEVEKFKPAIIIKPLESLHIETKPFSFAHIGSDKLDIDYNRPNKIDIYLISERSKIKTKIINPPSITAYFDFNHYRNASKSTSYFNGKVYNENVRYVIIYKYEGKELTAFVNLGGHISEDWFYRYNAIPESHMESREKVKEYLLSAGCDNIFESLTVLNIDD